MRDILLIIKKELTGFIKSDRGIFILYGILVVAWSFLIYSNMNTLTSKTGYLWLVSFSVIVSGNFSTTTFVSERMSGSLEILLTSGVTRRCILLGKILYVILYICLLNIVIPS